MTQGNFDTNHPFWVLPSYAKKRIQNAWIGQCLADTYISRLIRMGTQGVHSHSQMFARDCHGEVDILELREFKGGRRHTFEYHLQHPGRIDVFSPDTEKWPDFDAEGAVEAMRQLTNYEYGWKGIGEMLARRVPFVWRLFSTSTDDRLPADGKPIRQPFCSHAVSLATHLGGGVDPVPRCPHSQVTPTHLTYSLFYRYEFTLVSEYCGQQYGYDIFEKAAINEEYLSQHTR